MTVLNRLAAIRIDALIASLVIAFAVCFNSCSALSTIKGLSSFGLPLAFIACLLLLCFPDAPDNKTKTTVSLFLFIVPIFLSSIASPTSSNAVNSLQLILIIILSYLCVRKLGALRFCTIFIDVMLVTSICSIVVWIALNFIGVDFPLPLLENVNGVHYKTLLVASYYVEPYIPTNFSMGFFWECGIFASYLLFAIVAELLVKRKLSKLRLIILAVALLTTGSTAGYLLLPVAISVGMLQRGGRARYVFVSALILTLAVVLANYSSIAAYLAQINPDMFSKLIDSNAVTRLSRLQSPAACWSLFLQRPILGYGYGGALDAYSAIVASSGTIDSLTSTSFFQLAAFGLGGIIMWVMAAYAIFGIRALTPLAKVALFVLVIIVINKEPHTASAMSYALLFSMISLNGRTCEANLRSKACVRDCHAL